MKSSSTSSLPKTAAEERVGRIRQLQAWLLSDTYPADMNRAKASVELMKLRNTRMPKKKAGVEQ